LKHFILFFFALNGRLSFGLQEIFQMVKELQQILCIVCPGLDGQLCQNPQPFAILMEFVGRKGTDRRTVDHGIYRYQGFYKFDTGHIAEFFIDDNQIEGRIGEHIQGPLSGVTSNNLIIHTSGMIKIIPKLWVSDSDRNLIFKQLFSPGGRGPPPVLTKRNLGESAVYVKEIRTPS